MIYVDEQRGSETLQDLAERAGIDPATFSRWRSGKNGVTVDSLRKLAKALKVSHLTLLVKAKILTEEEAGGVLPEPPARTTWIEEMMDDPTRSDGDKQFILHAIELTRTKK